jgi:toxin ParE1/3/4
MVEIIWTGPALNELDAIADYIALDKPDAAERLVKKIFDAVAGLARFPEMGRRIPEFRSAPYRELVVNPCRIFYRKNDDRIFVIFVMRGEREFHSEFLRE